MSTEIQDCLQGPVYLVDDDESFRKSVARLLSLSKFKVYDFASVGDFLLKFSRSAEGCLLLDIKMPGPDGMELLDYLRKEEVGPPVVFLTGHGDVPTAVEAMRKGAFDILSKPVEKERLIEVIRNALIHGEESIRKEKDRKRLKELFATLTPTEKKIYQMIIEGLPNKAIASRIGNAERTVKLHRSNLSRKLNAQCVADLVRFHFEAGLR
ncbi:response regulator transcription factor [Puniceicoccus vermicola]|uniref:Response regulator transcription factor n=1 Tax=Puniceicoccus vermicola TaxID=388746 RepID=A0A7X1E3J7_9BACT|nr:response regulator [Puniceicoccus vermicola]MBC2601565.1 response regulator transcription factor [Puniceicoccus vermicola]